MGTTQPLIVTLALDPAARERFDALRRAHFPPERDHLSAHVTLFHALPGDELDRVAADLAQAARRPPYAVEVTGVRFLGRGVAFDLRSAELSEVRGGLARAWEPWLTSQDRQGFRPHVTVQNKVDPARARVLHAELAAGFTPSRCRQRGWRCGATSGGLGSRWRCSGRRERRGRRSR